MVRYYGYYSNKSRGMRKKAGVDSNSPALMEPDLTSPEMRRKWAQLIQKIYQVDPLLCPQCQGSMKMIAFIEDADIIQMILTHLGLWETRNHDPPGETAIQTTELIGPWYRWAGKRSVWGISFDRAAGITSVNRRRGKGAGWLRHQ